MNNNDNKILVFSFTRYHNIDIHIQFLFKLYWYQKLKYNPKGVTHD